MSTRSRLVAAASELTCEGGWAAVTMGKVATRAGVSRQTLYNELGSKSELGRAMVLHELEAFLDEVGTELDRGDDLEPAVRAAVERTLLRARENPLLRALLASAHSTSRGEGPSAGNDLLPLLTTDAQPVIDAAAATISQRVAGYPDVVPDEGRRAVAVDAVVRLVLSHAVRPADDPRRTARDLAWVAVRLLRVNG